MFPPFPQEAARHYCQKFISDIEDGFVCLKQISQISQERQGHGVMVGSLVCYEKNNPQSRIVLHAISGISIQAFFFTEKGDRGQISVRTKTCDRGQISVTQQGIQHIIVPSIVEEPAIQNALMQNDEEIHKLTQLIQETKQNVTGDVSLSQQKSVTGDRSLSELKARRTKLTDESLRKVFSLYSFTRFDGKKITLDEIIQINNGKLPPTGTGDCCAPKLLSYAFEHNLIPYSMDEVFYGKDTKNKENGVSYPPCDERCGYILPHILGLEILYRDNSIIVVNKQSGLLSVPGRTPDKQDCIVNRVKTLFPNTIEQPSVHRLDMETSGLLILAFTADAHKNLSLQFEKGTVHKKYAALLDGLLQNAKGLSAPKNNEISGKIELSFRVDLDNRPHQIYDEINGKQGITLWKKEGTVLYTDPTDNSKRRATKIIFTPLTGRTHQLRLASSDSHGLGLPIIGDTLYGSCNKNERLMLHSFELTIRHPVSGEEMIFTTPLPQGF